MGLGARAAGADPSDIFYGARGRAHKIERAGQRKLYFPVIFFQYLNSLSETVFYFYLFFLKTRETRLVSLGST